MKINLSLTPPSLLSWIEPLESRIAPASAAPILVTNLHDSGDGSLRQAILLANSLPGSDTILFQDSQGGPLHGTISLASDLPDITDALLIQGPTEGKASGIVIKGNKHQIFRIIDCDASLQDLTITGGQSQNGGGIYINASGHSIVLADVTVSGNRAVAANFGDSCYGGGIDNAQGTLSISHSKITGNFCLGAAGQPYHTRAAALGGGIFSNGTLTITDSMVSGNVAQGGNAPAQSNGQVGGGASGGGIYAAYNSMVSVQRSVISGNKALGGNGSPGFKGQSGQAGAPGQNGGYGLNGTPGGAGGAGYGGGLYTGYQSQVSLSESTISGNLAKGGNGANGGEGGKGGAGGSAFTVEGTHYHAGIGGNGGAGGYGGMAGYGKGGGIMDTGSSTLTIQNSTISGNTATGSKAGIGGAGGAAGAGSYQLGNIPQHGSAGPRGYNGFNANYAYGGGIFSNNRLNGLFLSQVTIAKNSSGYKGGGVSVHGGSASIDNCTIAQNHAKVSGGGIDPGSTVTVVSSIIALNAAPGGPDVGGWIQAGESLIGNSAGAQVQPGSDTLMDVNPRLGPLGMHGGLTATMLPSLASPAIDAGSNYDGLLTDQRGVGFDRELYGSLPDIGAVEVGPVPPTHHP